MLIAIRCTAAESPAKKKRRISMYVGVTIAVVLVAGALYFFFLAQKEKRETTGFDPNRPVPSDAILKHRLKAEEYSVVREGGTQTPFQNEFWNNERTGIYVDVITGEPLFTSLDKFDGGLGMPTFSKPISKDLLVEKPGHFARVCSAPRCAPNEATPTLAMSFPTRNRPPAKATPFTRPPSISFRSNE